MSDARGGRHHSRGGECCEWSDDVPGVCSCLPPPPKPCDLAAFDRKGRGCVGGWLHKSANTSVFLSGNHIAHAARWLLIQGRKFSRTLKCCQGWEVTVESHQCTLHACAPLCMYVYSTEMFTVQKRVSTGSLTFSTISINIFEHIYFPSLSICTPPQRVPIL